MKGCSAKNRMIDLAGRSWSVRLIAASAVSIGGCCVF
jgi:hypothetical protein